jgi:hypothetical protein
MCHRVLQVLLDMLDLEELSDYLRLMCCRLKTHRPKNSAKNACSQDASKRPSSSATATAERPPSTTRALGKWRIAVASAAGSLKQAGRQHLATLLNMQVERHACSCAVWAGLDHMHYHFRVQLSDPLSVCVCAYMFPASPGQGAAESHGTGSATTSPTDGLTSRQRRMRAAAGVFELSQASFADPDSCQAEDSDKQQQQQSSMSGNAQPDLSSMGECLQSSVAAVILSTQCIDQLQQLTT